MTSTNLERRETEPGTVRRLLTAVVGLVLALLGLTLAAGPATAQTRVGAQPVQTILTVGRHGTAGQETIGVRGPPQLQLVSATGVAADTGGTSAGKAMSELDRTGSGLKGDVLHRSASWVVDDSGAQQFAIRGGDGVTRQLYQLPGEVNGKPGVFEWIVDDSGTDPVITHQRFINGGTVTGFPNQHP